MRSLRSVVLPAATWNPATESRNAIRYVDVSAVSRETLAIDPPIAIAAKDAPSRARKIVRQDDTLFATIRPTLKRVAKVPAELDDEIVSTAFCVLRPDTAQVDADYLFFLASSDAFVASVAEHERGASYPAVRDRDVLDQEIKLPALEEQRQVARTLGAIRAATLNEIDLLRVAKELKLAAMRELYTRGLRGEAQKETEIGLVPASWDVAPLGSLGKIGNGSTPKKTVPAYWNGGTFPWLTSAKVYDREIETADQFVTDVALDECHLPRVKSGAVLMAITGQGKTLGHCAVLRIEASISQHVAYLQTDTEKAEPGFVRGYLETQYDYLRQVASGGGSTKGALTCAFLRDLPLPLPPNLDEQREIVTILDALDRKIALHRQKRAVLEDMFQSMLHKLMAGEIRVSDLDLSALPSAPVEATEVTE
jgi:type I restriction enzyme, S subunit